MATARVDGRGRLTIPAEVRQALQIAAGDRVEFLQVEPGRFEVMAKTRPVDELKSLFGKPRKTARVEAMNPAGSRHPLR